MGRHGYLGLVIVDRSVGLVSVDLRLLELVGLEQVETVE